MASKLVSALDKETSKTVTENGMKTFTTSLSNCLDLFFLAGSSRNISENDIAVSFSKAFHENSDLAIKILAWSRDIREGVGERRFFKVCLNFLETNNYLDKVNLSYVPEIGRWDDIFNLKTPEIIDLIQTGLKDNNHLLAKWLPRGKSFNNLRSKIQRKLKLTPKEYRKLVVKLTNVVETQMCKKEWSKIDYSKIPSKANVKYNKGLLRNDENRRREFLSKAIRGEVKINSNASFPHEIVSMMVTSTGYSKNGEFIKATMNETAIAMWNQLPDYLSGSEEIRLLPVCDTSGSMRGLPIQISLGLGLYISERNKGIFKDAFITFSETPELQYTKGNLFERINSMKAFHPTNTNLEATFDLLLGVAMKHNLKETEMPTHILIISDMEFDVATNNKFSALKMIKEKYKEMGYELPNLVFWNVNSKSTNNFPVRFNKEGVALISGASPTVVKGVMSGKIDPISTMLSIVDVDRYKKLIK